MNLIEKTVELYDEKYDLNCAECILKAANGCYDLNISEQTMKAMASFGGGMSIGSVCGAATGAIAAIGIMFTRDRGHESPQVKEMTFEFMNIFGEKLGTLQCYELKERHRKNDKERCIHMMRIAAESLEDIIIKYKDIYPIIR